MSPEASVCMTCGQLPPAGATFCPYCGATLNRAAGQPPPYAPAPPLSGPRQVSPQESRNWAMAAHLTALAGALLGGLPAFVGPLVVWLVRREDDPFASDHGREALNFNLTALLIAIVGAIIGVITFGLGFIPLAVFAVLWLVWTIQGTIAASNGQPYRYPISIRFVS